MDWFQARSPKVCVAAGLTSALFALTSGCVDTLPTVAETAPPGLTGNALFKLITEDDPYQQWSQFPNVQGTVESMAPHGPMARIFINKQVEDALKDFAGSLPDGAIIVKENLGESESDKADALTIMWKVEGFDADNNDWFWANISPDGEVAAEGQVATCSGCHAGARNNDFVFVHEF